MLKTVLVEIDRMEQPEFRHREVCAILGIAKRTLTRWHDRGMVRGSLSASAPERGAGRIYSQRDLLYLALLDRLVPLLGEAKGISAAVTVESAGMLVQELTWTRATTPEIDPVQRLRGMFLVVFGGDDRTGSFSVELVERTRLDLSELQKTARARLDPRGLDVWSHLPDRDVAVIIDAFAMVRRVFASIAVAREARK